VYYEKDGETIAYTIVGGDALEGPERSVAVQAEGTPVRLFAVDGVPTATWEREGHTCVLTGAGVEPEILAELAGWKGKGAVAF
jgi:hypothetical protein